MRVTKPSPLGKVPKADEVVPPSVSAHINRKFFARRNSALTIRRNVINRPNRYDLLIELTMTPDMLPAYDASEPHHRWKETFGARIQQKAIFDYE